VLAYYQELFRGILRREYNQVWNALASAVADLPAPELIEDLRKAYEDRVVDSCVVGLKELEQDALVPLDKKPESNRERTNLVSDAISEMDWWYAFHVDDDAEPVELDEVVDEPMLPLPSIHPPQIAETVRDPVPSTGIRRDPKIGRNDPCPCGSGKKYKKCCLGKGTESD
jgi:preprotein translocase subunit SecA